VSWTRIDIEQTHRDGHRRAEVTWETVPAVGDSVDLQDPESGENPGGIAGRVKNRVFWGDGSVCIVLEPRL
jgi:hypothetical protein